MSEVPLYTYELRHTMKATGVPRSSGNAFPVTGTSLIRNGFDEDEEFLREFRFALNSKHVPPTVFPVCLRF
jgi:hypothetical protein